MSLSFVDHAFKHGLSEDQIRHAWENFLVRQHRDAPKNDQVLVIGYDTRGNLIEIVALCRGEDYLIYHAMSPPTKKFLREVGF